MLAAQQHRRSPIPNGDGALGGSRPWRRLERREEPATSRLLAPPTPLRLRKGKLRPRDGRDFARPPYEPGPETSSFSPSQESCKTSKSAKFGRFLMRSPTQWTHLIFSQQANPGENSKIPLSLGWRRADGNVDPTTERGRMSFTPSKLLLLNRTPSSEHVFLKDLSVESAPRDNLSPLGKWWWCGGRPAKIMCRSQMYI